MQVQFSRGRVITLGYRPDPLDPRDYRFAAPAFKPLPEKVDNRAKIRRIRDQGNEGSCTGFAACAAAELLFGICCTEGTAPDLSERWAYHHARRYDPWEGENYHGSTLRAALEGWLHHGICEEQFWRYSPYPVREGDKDFELVAWEKQSLKAGAVENARAYSLTAYQRLGHLLDVKRALVDNHVVLVGASIHSGWDVWGDDRIQFTDRSVFLGLHAFILVGYDDRDATFLVANSWGSEWGDRGVARLPYADLRVNMVDAWTAMVPCRC